MATSSRPLIDPHPASSSKQAEAAPSEDRKNVRLAFKTSKVRAVSAFLSSLANPSSLLLLYLLQTFLYNSKLSPN